MADISQSSIVSLLANSKESLEVEIKGWLDLSSSRDKATLAKAALALANHGGGVIILGLSEVDGGYISEANPYRSYDTDLINSSISQYSEPPFHCELHSIDHPETGNRHFVVVVPDTLRVPVMTKKGSEIFEPRKVFIRKPGPKSEEIMDAAEWQTVMDKIQRLNSNDLSKRNELTDQQALTDFQIESHARWRHLSKELPNDHLGKLRNGYFEIAFSMLGLEHDLSLNELKSAMNEASAKCSSIYFLFKDVDRRAKPFGRSIESSFLDQLGRPFSMYELSYWRSTVDAKFYLIRGYQEDADDHHPKFFYTVPIWRIGRSLDYAATICRLLGENLQFMFSANYTGLIGRELFDTENVRYFGSPFQRYVCADSDVALQTIQLSPKRVNDSLPDVLYNLLLPLYEQFSFFELPKDVVAKEVQEMRRHGHSRHHVN